MRLHFLWIGKTKDRRCAALIADYLERIGHFASSEVTELKDQTGGDEKRLVAAEGSRIVGALERDDFVLLLDEGGTEMTSKELAGLIEMRQLAGVKRMGVVVGGFAGVSDEVRKRAHARLSLSRLTLTHELARVVLLEQIYRAFTLIAGLPYHR
ncbi:MAG: 23S rRNA (pseudouridine(1915)-N(3))-methyltransferase RlmH [Acidobacteriota bacterium]